MTGIPLSETLAALVESIEPPDGSGLRIESATLDVPLEIGVASSRHGPVFLAGLPFTRWQSGVLPVVHTAHLEIGPVAVEDEG
ncbi:MAG TPA: hypothetical protein VHS03_13200 [Gaiellaceae bacterium]|jgi:hypothetical protein|nr:hypothetical protein [Gaiellaceae bacterium]